MSKLEFDGGMEVKDYMKPSESFCRYRSINTRRDALRVGRSWTNAFVRINFILMKFQVRGG
jgi:hypothetical protein